MESEGIHQDNNTKKEKLIGNLYLLAVVLLILFISLYFIGKWLIETLK